MKIRAFILGTFTLLAANSISYVAASTDTVPANVTASTVDKPFLEKLAEYGTVNYFGIYRGSSLSSLGSPLQPKVDGTLDPTSPSMLDSSITAGYKVSKEWIVGAVGHFYLFPWNDPTGGGQKVQSLDPILFVSRPGLIDSQGFKLDTRLTMHLPVSKFDTLASKHLATAISAVFNARYEIPTTKLTVGTFGFLRGYIPAADLQPNAPSYTLTAAPYANYQISDNVAATLWVDLVQATRNYGTGIFSGLQNAQVDIEPGISWDITKNITINPVLNIYPGHPTLASTSIQAYIIAKAF